MTSSPTHRALDELVLAIVGSDDPALFHRAIRALDAILSEHASSDQ